MLSYGVIPHSPDTTLSGQQGTVIRTLNRPVRLSDQLSFDFPRRAADYKTNLLMCSEARAVGTAQSLCMSFQKLILCKSTSEQLQLQL